jgi:hypothetical protein
LQVLMSTQAGSAEHNAASLALPSSEVSVDGVRSKNRLCVEFLFDRFSLCGLRAPGGTNRIEIVAEILRI